MFEPGEESERIARAVAGDRSALERLLLDSDERLMREVAGWIPPELASVVSPEDVLQEVYIEAFRHVSGFRPRGDDALR